MTFPRDKVPHFVPFQPSGAQHRAVADTPGLLRLKDSQVSTSEPSAELLSLVDVWTSSVKVWMLVHPESEEPLSEFILYENVTAGT